MFPVDIESVHGVDQRFVAHCNFAGKRFFIQMHDGSAQLEIIAEIIHPVDSCHGLALHAVLGIAFQLDAHAGACINNALVDDSHSTHTVIYGVVCVLNKSHTAGCDDYGTTGYIDGT